VLRNYYPDFVIDNKYIVECKPKKLWDTNINKLKFESAKIFCENNKYKFKITDLKRIEKDKLLDLVESGLIVLTKKWRDKLSRHLI